MNHGSIARYFGRMSEALNRKDTIDAVFANAILSSPQSHSVELWQRLVARGAFPDIDAGDLDGEAYFVIDSAKDLDRRWPEILATQPQFIKVMLQYSEEYNQRRKDSAYFGFSGLNPILIPDIVARAHEAGLRVSAHIETAADFRLAVEAGVDIIAHLPGYDVEIDDDISRYRLTRGDALAAAAKDIIVLTTTLLSRDRAEDQPRKLSRMLENHEANLRLLAAAGVRIGVGSDQFSKHSVDELMSLATLKLFDNSTLLEMIAISTPTAIFPERRIGHLVEGAEASFLVLPGNPLQNIAEIRNIEMRVKNGQFLDIREALPK